jgi:dTMP kinase
MTHDIKQQRTRGRLIVIDGPDGVGKTTVTESIGAMPGFIRVKAPDRSSPTGKLLDAFIKRELQFSDVPLLNERAAQMIFTANYIENSAKLNKLLDDGLDVVMDRYIPSAVVYHAAATGQEEVSVKFIREITKYLPDPDLVIILDLDPNEAKARIIAREGSYGAERNDTLEMQIQVGKNFHKYFGDATFIDASGSKDEVLAACLLKIRA